jgi:hypothetical protein
VSLTSLANLLCFTPQSESEPRHLYIILTRRV